MLYFWRPRRTKDLGSHVNLVSSPIASLTVNGTTRAGIAAASDKDDTAAKPGNLVYVDELFVASFTVPADADGTILLSVKKYDASAAAARTLVTGTGSGQGDLEALVAGKAERLAFDAAATDDFRTLDFGDYLYCEVVNNSAAIDTQPSGLVVSAKLKYLT